MPTEPVHDLETVQRGLFNGWNVAALVLVTTVAVGLAVWVLAMTNVSCDDRLDTLREVRAEYYELKTARGLFAWGDAERDYCEHCNDVMLCVGGKP